MSMPAWPGENLMVVESFMALVSRYFQAPTPTLPRLRGRESSQSEGRLCEARRLLPPPQAGERWGGGFCGSCDHPLAGTGDPLDGGEPVGQLALGRLGPDLL